MRIVAGSAGGRLLVTPDNDDVRPTKDRVREAVFNSLFSHDLVEDRSFLDLFAGSGALGLEALSRGALSCTFVDNDRRSLAIVQENVDKLGFGPQATVRLGDAMRLLAGLSSFDVALLDPPYEFDQWPELLNEVPAPAVVIESDRPVDPGERWRILKEKQYAGTVVVIAERLEGVTNNPAAPEDVDNT